MGNILPYCRICQLNLNMVDLGKLSLYAVSQDWEFKLVIDQMLIDGDVIEACVRRLQDVDCDCWIRNA